MTIDVIIFAIVIITVVSIVLWDISNEEEDKMGNQTDYFNKIGYKHTYNIGDRVFGKWNEIPFIGTVGNDRLINDIDGPEVTIHLDLPIKIDKEIKSFIIVKHADIKQLLKEY